MKKSFIGLLGLCLFWNVSYTQTETESSAIEQAKSFEDKEDYQSALRWYHKASQINPKNSTTYYDVAWCQNELGLYEDVILTVEKASSIAPSAKVYSEGGYAYYKLKNYAKAIETYKRSLALNPEETDAVKGLADSYYEKGDNDNALIYYKKCVTLGKNTDYANYKMAYIMNDKKSYQKAVEYAQAATRGNDQYADAFNELGYAYDMLGQSEMALDNYQRAAALQPDNATYNFNIADIYYKGALKDYDKAIIYYKKGLEEDKKSAVYFYKLGWIYNEKARYDDALPYLNKAVEIDPGYGLAWLELGYIDLFQKNYYAAESKLLKHIQLDNKSELGRYYLGQVYIGQGKTSNAQRMVDELKGLNSKYADQLKAKM